MSGFTLAELAARVGGSVIGNGERRIHAVRALDAAAEADLSFFNNARYLDAAQVSRAGALLVADPTPFPGRDLIVCRDPDGALAEIVALVHPTPRPLAGVHPTAVVAPSARVAPSAAVGTCAVIEERAVIGENAVVDAGCFIGADAEIGADTLLHPHVVVEARCRVGARCILHAGVVLGADGFRFTQVRGEHKKVPQVGIVVLEDDVELGANVCIDRAALGETRIGRGTKVDNLVHIGHNVTVGEHSLLVAQVGISGSTQLGRHVIMAGQSGASGHLHLGDGTVVTAQAGVMADTEPGAMVSGIPARPHREWLKAQARLYQLEDLRRRVAKLEKEIDSLGGSDD